MATPWPPSHLVAECRTRSAPCSKGRLRKGVEKVEIDQQRNPGFMGDLGDGLQIEQLQPGIADGLGEDQPRLGTDRLLEAGDIARRHEAGGDGEARQGVAEEIDAAAIERGGGDDMAARAHQRGDGEMQCGMAAGGGHGADAAFQCCHALLQHGDGRVGDPRIDMADALQVEQRRGRLDIAKDIGGGLIDRHRSRAGGGIGPLAGMQAQRLETEELGVGHGLEPVWRREPVWKRIPLCGIRFCFSKNGGPLGPAARRPSPPFLKPRCLTCRSKTVGPPSPPGQV